MAISLSFGRDATPHDPALPLCASCKHAMHTRDSLGRSVYRCGVTHDVLRRKIVECSTFYPHGEPWMYEYESLAWVWASGANGEPAFVRLRDLQVGTPGMTARPGF